MSAADVVRRAEHARAFLETAEDARALHPERSNVVVANAVLAGIAAADAICGRVMGVSAKGEDHGEAARLLDGVATVGARAANDLKRLLAVKTNSSYSPVALSESAASDALRWAGRLVEAMDKVLRGA